jgi:hypothetical protein
MMKLLVVSALTAAGLAGQALSVCSLVTVDQLPQMRDVMRKLVPKP